MRLSTKLFLVFLPAVAAVLAGLLLVAVDAFQDAVLRGHHERLSQVLRSLQQAELQLPEGAEMDRVRADAEMRLGLKPGIGDHYAPDPGTPEGALALGWQDTVLRQGRHLTVLRADGTLILSTMPGGRDYEALWRDLLDGRTAESPALEGIVPLPGRSVPYVAGGYPPLGWILVVTVPRNEIATVLKNLQWLILGAGAALSVLLLTLGWLLARRLILRPAVLLQRAARDIAALRPVSRIPVEGSDELAGLARALEDMAGELATAFGALRRERDMSTVLMSSAPAAVALLDADRRILQANGRFGQAFGAPVAGRQIADVVAAPADREEAAGHFAASRPAAREFQLPGGSDSAVFAWTVAALPPQLGAAPGGAPEGPAGPAFVATGLDVTARHRAEAERRVLQARLEHRERLETLGTFAGGIAHDLNNILTPVVGYVRMAEDLRASDGDADADAGDREAVLTDYLGRIRKAADRARYVIRQILTFGRKVGPEAELLDLAEMAGDSLELELPESETGLSLVRDFPAEAADRPLVNADPVQLHQVLTNLVTNARHAMPDGGEIRVAVRIARAAAPDAESAADWALLQVTDSGTGMKSEVAARIFEPFFTTKRTGRGTGLGLSVAHGIIGAHGGWIEVDSELGRGTAFSIYLPLAGTAAAPPAPATAPAAPRPAVSRPAGDGAGVPVGLPEGLLVLVVDDEAEPRDLAATVLARAGCTVRTASGGEAALSWLRELAADGTLPDLVLTDLTMPGIGGLDLAAEIGRLHPRLPLVAMTGGPPGAGVAEAFAACLSKPFAPDDLVAALREALAQGRKAP
ncbi:MAG: ATP-binding protein [Sneathiellaceae bacterium]